MNNKALIIVDAQNDFISGALPVPFAKNIIGPINKLINENNFVIASLDFHPKDHSSFKDVGGDWPTHCVQNTIGAELNEDINKEGIDYFVYKGMDRYVEEYSAFGGKTKDGRSLDELLKEKDIDTLIISGLALDVCVENTIVDALKFGFNVKVYKDSVEAVENKEKTLARLKDKGVTIL